MLKKSQSDLSPLKLPTHDSFDYLPGAVEHGLILIADHAGALVPEGYGSLGLGPDQFERHIAYDIGVRKVVLGLAAALGAPLLMGKYSRLFIDINRGIDDPTLIMKLSDGAVVPGNLDVDADERAHRVKHFFQPYHDAVDMLIDHYIRHDIAPVLLSVHSFTPAWKGVPRPWHASVLWDRDDRLVRPLLKGMRASEGHHIGDNVPYSGELAGDTLNSHGTRRGVAHALIEIRQDLIGHEDGQREWADRISRIIGDIMEDENFRQTL